MKKILVIGDIILDKFSYGYVNKLNPEAPVPLLKIEKEEYKLGGAGNVAANVSSLNGSCFLIGFLGGQNGKPDQNGNIVKSICEDLKIGFYYFTTGFDTIVKQRFIEMNYHQQLLRADYEDRVNLTQENRKFIMDKIKEIDPSYLVISDYLKGTFDPELVKMLLEFSHKNNILVLVDSKSVNIDNYKGVYLFKPNFKEFCKLIGTNIENEDSEIEQYGKKIVNEMMFNLLITRGSKGASLITKTGECFHVKSTPKQVFDVTGAGDTFFATLTYALSMGYSLKDAMGKGNEASSIVVGKVGTATISLNEINI